LSYGDKMLVEDEQGPGNFIIVFIDGMFNQSS